MPWFSRPLVWNRGQRGNSSFLSVHKSEATFRDCHGPMVDRYSTPDSRQSYLATAVASAPALALGSLRVTAVHYLRHCSKSGPEVVHSTAALLRGCLGSVNDRRGWVVRCWPGRCSPTVAEWDPARSRAGHHRHGCCDSEADLRGLPTYYQTAGYSPQAPAHWRAGHHRHGCYDSEDGQSGLSEHLSAPDW